MIMGPIQLAQRLDELAAMREALKEARKPFDEKITSLQLEMEEATRSLRVDAEAYEEAIKDDVISLGISVKGSALHAVYMKGRVTWDSSILEGYAVAHPEIKVARKEGPSTVQIRGAKS